MNIRRPLHIVACVAGLLFHVWSGSSLGGEPKKKALWQDRYSGEEATGKHVIALWHFDAGAPTQDSSGKGHDLKLRGKSRFAKDGRFGACLECFAAVVDKPEGAMTTRVAPDLTPEGPFTLELWFRPKPEMADQRAVYLLDCQYFRRKGHPQADHGYMFMLQKSGDKWKPVAFLGFGEDSERYTGRPGALEPGTWYHMAFTYDGAGTGRVCLNGKDIGGATCEARGRVSPAQYALAIGARYGSTNVGSPAHIDEVRITRGVTVGGLGIEVGTDDGRTAFRRMERGVRMKVRVVNGTVEPMSQVRLHVSFAGQRDITVPNLAPKQIHSIPVPVDTALRPDTYMLTATVSARGRTRTYEADQTVAVAIAPRPLPHTMPVALWGHGDFKRLKRIGFTHHIVHLSDYGNVWKAGRPLKPGDPYHNVAGVRQQLNEHLVQGIGVVAYVAPGRFFQGKKEFRRVDRQGQPYGSKHTSACVSLPAIQKHGYNVGASVANVLGTFPALQSALIHSEVRGGTNVCFHEHDKAAFRKHAGYPIPKEVIGSRGVRYQNIKGFPADRVIPDNHPVLTYYRWFWKDGDGWNPLHTQVHRGLKSTGRDDLWTFYDPAVRVPSIWGSGGSVDYLSQWTYTYPDPIKMGQSTDEMFAMAEGRRDRKPRAQQVMKMTQAIWYRSGVAPALPKDKSTYAQWEKDIPDARFVTIAPDCASIALWSKIARPIQGIMYHGWGSLVKVAKPTSYRFTNPKTADVLAELIRDVVRPLGPTLRRVPDRRADVAVLESFSSQMFAHRGTFGWSGTWEADMHLILQWAQIQPRILYDETVVRDGLDGVRVLVMPFCDVLTRTVAQRVAAFQKRGGIIVADEHLAPAIQPDILVPSYKRTKQADKDKAALQARAADLRRELDTVYQRYGESDNPDVVVRFRQYGDTDYLFAINDKRTFGTYLGHHGLIMEKGLPTAANLRIRRKAGHVYDLVAHKPVPVGQEKVPGTFCAKHPSGPVGKRFLAPFPALAFASRFAPGQGHLFMITDQKIADVVVMAPPQARLGKRVALRITVVDAAKKPMRAVVPVQVEVLDPKGRAAEFSGYYGAKDGAASIALDLARNDLPGEWTIRVTELASGVRRERKLVVKP